MGGLLYGEIKATDVLNEPLILIVLVEEAIFTGFKTIGESNFKSGIVDGLDFKINHVLFAFGRGTETGNRELHA